MVTSVLVGYVKERERETERDGGREVLRAFLVFCRQAIPPRDLSRKCFLNYTCLSPYTSFIL